MSLKDILVHIDNSRNSATRLEYAVRLAEFHEAHLTGLYVIAPSERIPGPAAKEHANYALPDFSGQSLRQFEKKAEDLVADYTEHSHLAAKSAEIRFHERAKEAGIGHEWFCVEENFFDALSHHARFCDVAVVGQPGKDSRRSLGESPTDHLILSVGHPILMVPTLGENFTVGKRVVIAWDRSPVATRTIHKARPFIRQAEMAKILAINLEPEEHGGVPGSGITEHLARHGIAAEPKHVVTEDKNISDVILAQAEEEKADLIVMGAYGHSRLRERILGGVTYDLLNHSPIPVLMNH